MVKIMESELMREVLGLGDIEIPIGDIYRKMVDYHRKEDLISTMGETEVYDKLSKEQKEEFAEMLVDRFDKALSHNQPYWDAYWETVNQLLQEEVDAARDVLNAPMVKKDENSPQWALFSESISEQNLTDLLSRIDFEWEYTQDDAGQVCICLTDLQGGNFGGIESERFYSVSEIIDRMDIYWTDEFLQKDGFGDHFESYEDALLDSLYKGDPETARLIAIVAGTTLKDFLDERRVEKVSACRETAVKHIDTLYENDLLPILSSGNYVVYSKNDGWTSASREAIIENLMSDLNGLDDVRHFLFLEETGIRLPSVDGLILHRGDSKLQPLLFDCETAYGEPQMWVYLYDGTSVEITHEEYALEEENQYFSVRHHCSEKDFDEDTYKATCGVISEFSSENLADVANEIKTLINKSLEGVK